MMIEKRKHREDEEKKHKKVILESQSKIKISEKS